MKKIRLGQIGIGHGHGHAKMQAARKFPELFEIVGYAEENEEWIEKRGSLPGYADLKRYSVEELIEKCDAILVESDVWNLTKYGQMCIDAGKHIHMDKPASGTLEEYKQLLDTAECKNLVIQLGYMYRYNPNIRKAFEMVKNGELGDICSIHAEMSTRHADSYRAWLDNFPGGNMYIFGSHLIDLIVSLLGKPQKVHSSLVRSGANGVDAPDVSAAILQYDHALARIFVSSTECNGWCRRTFSIAGTGGTVELRPMEDPVAMTYAKAEPGEKNHINYAKEIPTQALANDCRYDEMMKDFAAYIHGEKENPYTYEHEYTVQQVLMAATGEADL